MSGNAAYARTPDYSLDVFDNVAYLRGCITLYQATQILSACVGLDFNIVRAPLPDEQNEFHDIVFVLSKKVRG